MISAQGGSATREFGQIKAVCLDIDDTLLDSESASRCGLRALVGSDRAWPVWRRTTDQFYSRFSSDEIDFDVLCVERTQAFFAAFGQHIDAEEAARRETHRMAAMQHAWCLFDDVVECLDRLRAAEVPLAAITNAPGRYQRTKLASVGLTDAFDTVVISEEVGCSKPDSRIFGIAAERLGLPPADLVHVGDRFEADALGAVRAGLRGVWLDRGQDVVRGIPHPGRPRDDEERAGQSEAHDVPGPRDAAGAGAVTTIHDLRELAELVVGRSVPQDVPPGPAPRDLAAAPA